MGNGAGRGRDSRGRGRGPRGPAGPRSRGPVDGTGFPMQQSMGEDTDGPVTAFVLCLWSQIGVIVEWVWYKFGGAGVLLKWLVGHSDADLERMHASSITAELLLQGKTT